MIEFNASEVSQYYGARIPKRVNHGKYWTAPCPVHGGKNQNFSIDKETGQAKCHSKCGGRGFDIIGLEMELSGLDFGRAKESVFDLLGRPKEKPEDLNVQATYDYTDETGKLLYQAVRYYAKPGEKKKFAQRQPDGRGGWTQSIRGIKLVPYRLSDVLSASFVWVCEGEKDADNLRRAGAVATCNNGGAGNFNPAIVEYFSGKSVAIIPDNDDSGRAHALKVASLLKPVATSVRIVELSGLSEKGDVSDYLASGKSLSDLDLLYSAATEWTVDWDFTKPHENDKYLRTLPDAIAEAGGYREFWGVLAEEGIPTPCARITNALGGLRNGEFYVIGGNQGSGKTSLGLQFITAALLKQKGVFFFSMEMSHVACFQRMIGIEARVDLWQYAMQGRNDAKDDWYEDSSSRLKESTRKFYHLPLHVTTKSAVTPEMVVLESLRVSKRSKIDLIVLDHMQLMSSTGKERSDYEKFTAISRTLKGVAMELKIPILVVSQTSRRNAQDKRSELEVSDLRGTGALEEDAAGIMLLYPDAEDFQQAKLEGERAFRGPIKTWLKLGKNRFGPENIYQPLMHHKSLTRFDVAD